MKPEDISAVAGVVLAVVFEYFPYLSSWYDQHDEGTKRQIMLGTLVVVVAVAFGLSCANLVQTWPCTQAGAWQAVVALVYAIVGNQGVHLLTKKRAPIELPQG